MINPIYERRLQSIMGIFDETNDNIIIEDPTMTYRVIRLFGGVIKKIAVEKLSNLLLIRDLLYENRNGYLVSMRQHLIRRGILSPRHMNNGINGDLFAEVLRVIRNHNLAVAPPQVVAVVPPVALAPPQPRAIPPLPAYSPPPPAYAPPSPPAQENPPPIPPRSSTMKRKHDHSNVSVSNTEARPNRPSALLSSIGNAARHFPSTFLGLNGFLM